MFKQCLCFLFIASCVLRDYCVSESDDDGGRIIGGQITDIQDHPYQVSLRYKGRHICGGSIVADNYVLTAAHCVRRHPSHYSIKTSSTTLSGEGIVHHVEDVMTHEDYYYDNPDFDIALIKLESTIRYHDHASPIALATSDDHYNAGTKATVTGWGVWDTDISNYLREVDVLLVSKSLCLKLFDYKLVTDRMICAGYVGEGGRDACSGDSGGPLVQNGIQIGIVSWGYGCAKPSHPGVYTRVSSLRSWVDEKIGW